MKDQQRLTGIDLFRSLAIFAVILLHIDGGVKVASPIWSKITDFALFAVPFFLAASFYLATSKLYLSQTTYPFVPRLLRLLIPYGIWSIFYLVYKSTKYLIAGESSKLLMVFQDPLSLVFFGGAAFHLYFIPLLATGTLLLKFTELLISRKVSLKGLCVLTLISLLIYEVVLSSGNSFKAPTNVAFEALLATVFPTGNSNPLLRWVLVELFWSIRCVPYIMVAMLLAHPAIRQRSLKLMADYSLLWLLIFLVLNTFGALILPPGTYEVARGYTALVAAIALSDAVRSNSLTRSLGLASFGIYLIHLIFVEIFQIVFIRLYPNYIYDVNVAVFLLASIVILVVSWGITEFARKSKKLSQLLFGY